MVDGVGEGESTVPWARRWPFQSGLQTRSCQIQTGTIIRAYCAFRNYLVVCHDHRNLKPALETYRIWNNDNVLQYWLSTQQWPAVQSSTESLAYRTSTTTAHSCQRDRKDVPIEVHSGLFEISSPVKHSPRNAINFYPAVHYCHRLSRKLETWEDKEKN